jgi:diaminopimelate decarboxylase
MDYFNYREDGELLAEQCAVSELVAQYGTPLYIYSRATIERHWKAFDAAAGDVPHLICYAVKANGNLAILNLLARLGSGFDIVSGGELARVIAAGGDAKKVVFLVSVKLKPKCVMRWNKTFFASTWNQSRSWSA